MEQYVSGVILYEETLEQTDGNNVPFARVLQEKGVHAGIKVDQGLEPMPDSPDETITGGLIGLPQRLARYRLEHGTSFTKWRAAIRIDGTRLPTSQAIYENARRLAQYAHAVQQAGMVPMVEPEVLLDGTHSRVRSREVLTQTLSALMQALTDQAVDMSAVILKTAMVISGDKSGKTDSADEVARDTVAVLMETVPKDIPGIVFLSGGQGTEQATENMQALRRVAAEVQAPWPLTFSYARALQDEALTIWKGKPENVDAAREAFLARLVRLASA
jgi:fructose-bisphosphate aldolase class I